jgi:hypothetical protein
MQKPSALLIGLLLLVATVSTAGDVSALTSADEQVLDAVTYLCNNYNKTTGLICNSPDDSSPQLKNTYYIYSDNYLAGLVLWNYDPTNSALTRMAENITNAVRDYTVDIAPINQYMVLTMAYAVNEYVFNASKDFDLTNDNGAMIKTTQNNQSGSLDQRNYADIAFLKAIYYHELGREDDAMASYNDGLNLSVYLAVGMGFKDDSFEGNYETYKLALYILASTWLGHDYDPRALETLLEMQKPGNGGFVSFYDSDLNQVGSTNAETTSLAVLSLIPLPLEPIPEFGAMPFVVLGFMLIFGLAWRTGRERVQRSWGPSHQRCR